MVWADVDLQNKDPRADEVVVHQSADLGEFPTALPTSYSRSISRYRVQLDALLHGCSSLRGQSQQDVNKPTPVSMPPSAVGNGQENAENSEPPIHVSGNNTSKPLQKWKKEAISFIDDQWFLISMGLVIAIASQVQVRASQQETKSTTVSYLCVSLIFLATGCTLDTKVLLRNASRWRTHLWVQGNCFLTCSALMFGIVSATATNKDFMDPGLLIGLVFFSCVPTTIASNVVMTSQAQGNTELTVVQTSIGNFIGVFISPALVVMYTTVDTWYNSVLPPSSSDQFTQIYRRVLMQLGLSIYVPLAVGQVIRYFFTGACNTLFRKYKLSKIGSLCMLVILWSTYDQAFRSEAFEGVKPSNLVFLVFVLLGTWLVYFAIAFFISSLWFPKRDVISMTYCVAAKGPAFGVPLSNAIFSNIDLELESKIQVPIVIYAALQMAFGSILVVIFRRWVKNAEQKEEDRVAEQRSRQVEMELEKGVGRTDDQKERERERSREGTTEQP